MHAQRAEIAVVVCVRHFYLLHGFVHRGKTEFLDQAVLQMLRITGRMAADAVHLQHFQTGIAAAVSVEQLFEAIEFTSVDPALAGILGLPIQHRLGHAAAKAGAAGHRTQCDHEAINKYGFVGHGL